MDTIIKGKEEYMLEVTPEIVVAKARTTDGLFYAVQSLLQLLPPSVEGKQVVKTTAWEIPAVQIKDYPRFPYRGVMLDPCRHFFTVDEIKKIMDEKVFDQPIRDRGLSIVGFVVESVTLDAESEKKIDNYELSSNSYMDINDCLIAFIYAAFGMTVKIK